MTPEQFWKNFNLLDEVSIAGAFVYNGLRRFHEMQHLEYTDELFEFFYNLSAGIERLLKVAIVLLEHNETADVQKLEQSLITHSHLDLLDRIKKHSRINFGPAHNEFLSLLSKFYKSYRYNRFLASSVHQRNQEKAALLSFLSKYLKVEFDTSSWVGIPNDSRYKKFVRKVVIKISADLYEIIRNAARAQNLYTHELRHDSRAENVFLGGADLPTEDTAWKELVVYLMNTKDEGGALDFIRSIPPLEFDPALLHEYLDSLRTATMGSEVTDLVETLYEDIEGDQRSDRLNMLSLIANPQVDFDIGEGEDEDF